MYGMKMGVAVSGEALEAVAAVKAPSVWSSFPSARRGGVAVARTNSGVRMAGSWSSAPRRGGVGVARTSSGVEITASGAISGSVARPEAESFPAPLGHVWFPCWDVVLFHRKRWLDLGDHASRTTI